MDWQDLLMKDCLADEMKKTCSSGSRQVLVRAMRGSHYIGVLHISTTLLQEAPEPSPAEVKPAPVEERPDFERTAEAEALPPSLLPSMEPPVVEQPPASAQQAQEAPALAPQELKVVPDDQYVMKIAPDVAQGRLLSLPLRSAAIAGLVRADFFLVKPYPLPQSV